MKTNGYFGALMIINDLGRGKREELIIVAAVVALQRNESFYLKFPLFLISVALYREVRSGNPSHSTDMSEFQHSC